MVMKTATRETKGGASLRTVPCRHYWVIDAPEGRLSSGECLLCGELRKFPNYLSDCLADHDREKFDEWVNRQYRKRPKRKDNLELLPESEEDVQG